MGQRVRILVLVPLIFFLLLPFLSTRGINAYQKTENKVLDSYFPQIKTFNLVDSLIDKTEGGDNSKSAKVEPTISAEVVAREYIPPPPPVKAPVRAVVAIPRPVGNFFPFGQCTWGVANLRAVSWGGNAYQWWANSAGIRPRGSTPQVGAIMVSWESPLGHVAYVTGVNSNGSFTVKEMNAYFNGGGWGKYSFRTIYPGTISIIGFIY